MQAKDWNIHHPHTPSLKKSSFAVQVCHHYPCAQLSKCCTSNSMADLWCYVINDGWVNCYGAGRHAVISTTSTACRHHVNSHGLTTNQLGACWWQPYLNVLGECGGITAGIWHCKPFFNAVPHPSAQMSACTLPSNVCIHCLLFVPNSQLCSHTLWSVCYLYIAFECI